MRAGRLAWIAANEAVVDSSLTVDKNRTLFSCADIVAFQGQSLVEKTAWFLSAANSHRLRAMDTSIWFTVGTIYSSTA